MERGNKMILFIALVAVGAVLLIGDAVAKIDRTINGDVTKEGE